jgi:hypothetical protein
MYNFVSLFAQPAAGLRDHWRSTKRGNQTAMGRSDEGRHESGAGMG